jgi:spore coat polysaccharide biosynthesis protein SpsF
VIVAILQARMSSTRLPGKAMRPLLGEPMVGRQIERLLRCREIDRLVVATSDDASDDPLAAYCETTGAAMFRGALADVLDRFYRAAVAQGPADHVVRLTADCPLADPAVIDDCIRLHVQSGADYTSNTQDRSYPDGLDVEVMTFAALEAMHAEAADPYEREHVTPFLYRHPERFRIAQLTQADKLDGLAWTVDVADDLAFVEKVYEALYPARPDFGQADVLALDFGRRRA